MILAIWTGCYALSFGLLRVLAVDAGTVGLTSACLSFTGAILVAFLNGRGPTRRRVAGALVEALADLQARLEIAERERDEAVHDLEGEKRARLGDLRALSQARGIDPGEPPAHPPKRRR